MNPTPRRLVAHAAALAAIQCLPAVSFAQAKAPNPFAENVRTTPALSPEDERKSFRLPPGFEIELVAAEPAIAKPMNMAFDAKGRLWITETREYPFPVKPEERGRDAIKVLEDADGDGRFEKVTTFAEGLNIPIGLYPYKNGVIAHSIPNVSFFQDTDGDGKADKRDVLYSTFGSRDTHGMTNSFRRGFDGWLYATHGFNNESTVKGADGDAITLRSGNVYRMNVDGKRVEPFAWGPVNPFGATFDSLGNFYVSDCHSWPLISVLRGAHYPHFGNPHDGLGFGPPMLKHTHNSTALDGACFYEADDFPAEYRNNFFVGNVVTGRINRDTIEDHGSTRIAKEAADFLTTEDPWFRPVDIQLGPDGALYVADFYNRIIGHYEVPLDHPGRDRDRGRIWRIRYTGNAAAANAANQSQASPAAPDASATSPTSSFILPPSSLPPDALVAALASANIKTRFLAADELSDRVGVGAVPALERILDKPRTPEQKSHALWLLHRFGALDASALAAAATDSDRTVRTHALRILSETPRITPAQRDTLVAGLRDADAFVRRAAADALSLHTRPENLRPLLDALYATSAEDTHLIHTLRMAVRNHFRTGETFAQLPLPGWTAKDGRTVADVALSIPTEPCAAFLLKYLSTPGNAVNDLPAYVRHVARFAPAAQAAAVVGLARTRSGADPDAEARLLKAVVEGSAQRGVAPADAARAWAGRLIPKLLNDAPTDRKQRGLRQQLAADLARSLDVKSADAAFVALLSDKSADLAARAAAAKILLTGRAAAHVPLVASVVNDGSAPAPLRDAAAQALAELDAPAARTALLSTLAAAPQPLQVKIALALAGSRDGAEALLRQISAGQASARLLLEPAVVQRLKSSNADDLDARVARLTKGMFPLSAELQKTLDDRRKAYDPKAASADAGAALFAANCIACHAVDGQGGQVGPQLDGIGARGLDRLVEDVLDPNRNVDPAFYSSAVTLKNGEIIDGLFRREEGELLVFATTTGQEIKVAKADVKKRTDYKRSLMPDNFHESLSAEDFNHLLSFLLSKAAK